MRAAIDGREIYFWMRSAATPLECRERAAQIWTPARASVHLPVPHPDLVVEEAPEGE